jgi:hypothetical protein
VGGPDNALLVIKPRIVASLDRKRLGGRLRGRSGISVRGVFDKETRRKPLAFAADAVRYGI